MASSDTKSGFRLPWSSDRSHDDQAPEGAEPTAEAVEQPTPDDPAWPDENIHARLGISTNGQRPPEDIEPGAAATDAAATETQVPEESQRMVEMDAPSAPAAAPIEGRDIVVENDLLRAVFSTAGGRLENVKLKKFRQDVAADSPPLDLLHEVPEPDRPLGLVLRRGGTDVDDSTVLYEADRDSVSVSGTDSGEVTLRGVLGGAQIVKRIRARGDRYLLEVDVEVAPGSAPSPEQIGIAWQDHIGHPARLSNTVMTTSVLAIQDSHLHRFGTQCWFLDRMRGQCHTLDDHAGTNLS